MRLDWNVAVVRPLSVDLILKLARLLGNRSVRPSKDGNGGAQSDGQHLYWHVDVCHINAAAR